MMQDFREMGPPGDIGSFLSVTSIIVYQHRFSGTTYICAARQDDRGWVLVSHGTDARTVIQAAINALPTAGGKIFIRAGTYTLTLAIDLRQHLIIEGEGPEATVITVANNANCDGMRFTIPADTHVMLTIRNLTLTGNRTNNVTGRGINIAPAAGVLLDVHIIACYVCQWSEDGVYNSTPGGCIIDRCWIEFNDGDGVHFNGADGGWIFHTKISANIEHGVHVDTQCNQVRVIICEIRGNYKHGVFINAGGTVISHCKIHNNSQELVNSYDGVRINDGKSYNRIIGNQIDGNNMHRYGISIGANADYNITMENHFLNNVTEHYGNWGSNNICRYNRGYVTENSGNNTGTGAQQAIPHGLSGIPNRVILWDIEIGANAYQSAVADANNIYLLAVINQDYGWEAKIV